MHITDLEMYRWNWHRMFLLPNTKHILPYGMTWRQWWKERGAFVSVLPRQTGKSTMIARMVNCIGESDDYRVVVRDFGCVTSALNVNPKKIIIPSGLKLSVANGNYRDIGLFVDEFSYFEKVQLDFVLNHPWKSVTMVSTLK